jgi:2-oxoglutarate ferredoxin oxidoreductase subunit delta
MCPILMPSSGQEGTLGEYWREPLDAEKHIRPKGSISLIKDRCKSCRFCIEFCPQGVLELSDEFNAKGYYLPKVKEDGDCITCRLCELICPEFAIYISEDQALTTTNQASHEQH